jgi:nicotinamidase/pyrazinamidase
MFRENKTLKQICFQRKDLNLKIHLLIIDPQSDFCKPPNKDGKNAGALYVAGAEMDMHRLAKMVNRLKDKLDDIHVTLDSHHLVDIAHPIFWVDSKGKHPNPFTLIFEEDVKNGVWRATNPNHQKRALEYVQSLKANNRYVLCIWPPHCLIGSDGYKIYNGPDDGKFPADERLYDALLKWENDFAMVDYVTKGSNLWTEHYSAVQADVPDPMDPDTQLNMRLIKTLQDPDIVLLAGEALSHCVLNTVTDIANNFGEENIKKLVLLTDATSPVPNPPFPGAPDFVGMGQKFIKDMKARGMQVSTTTEFLK